MAGIWHRQTKPTIKKKHMHKIQTTKPNTLAPPVSYADGWAPGPPPAKSGPGNKNRHHQLCVTASVTETRWNAQTLSRYVSKLLHRNTIKKICNKAFTQNTVTGNQKHETKCTTASGRTTKLRPQPDFCGVSKVRNTVCCLQLES